MLAMPAMVANAGDGGENIFNDDNAGNGGKNM